MRWLGRGDAKASTSARGDTPAGPVLYRTVMAALAAMSYPPALDYDVVVTIVAAAGRAATATRTTSVDRAASSASRSISRSSRCAIRKRTFTDSGDARANWLIRFATFAGATVIASETAESPVRRGRTTYERVEIAFENVVRSPDISNLDFALPPHYGGLDVIEEPACP